MIVYANDDDLVPPASYCESRTLDLLLVSGSWRREVCWGAVPNIFSIIKLSERKCSGYCCATWTCGTAWIREGIQADYRIESWNVRDNTVMLN